MAEGWLVEELCVWIFEYMERVDKSMPKLWSTKYNDRLVGKVQQGKDIQFCMIEEVREKVQAYCIANVDIMQEWLQQYKQAREVDSTLPISPSQAWIYKYVVEAKENGKVISIEMMDYAYGCDWHVSIFDFIVSIFCFSQNHLIFEIYNPKI